MVKKYKMAQFRPQFTIHRNESNGNFFNDGYHTHNSIILSFPTYRELKQKLVSTMKKYSVNEVTVSRSRRGEWGEWFENWSLHGEVLVIDKEGWM